jgi:hypothetical protein
MSNGDDPDDGGLPPGGAPPQTPCDCGPCPGCAADRQMSSPCIFQLGHADNHQCAYGDVWEQADPSATAVRRCPAKCPTCGRYCTYNFIHVAPHLCGLGHTW